MPPAEPPLATIRPRFVKPLRDEILASSDEIVERVELGLVLAILVPAIALVLAAANVGNGEDEAAIDQR